MIGKIFKEEEVQHPCLFQTPAYRVYVENATFGWTLHCYVDHWSKSIYKELLFIIGCIQEAAPRNEVYCVSNNAKLSKFSLMFGMEHVDDIHDQEGNWIGELRCLTL